MENPGSGITRELKFDILPYSMKPILAYHNIARKILAKKNVPVVSCLLMK